MAENNVIPLKGPNGEDAITKRQYDDLRPYEQGFISFTQSEWNPNVPKKCPYDSNKNHEERLAEEWLNGHRVARVVGAR